MSYTLGSLFDGSGGFPLAGVLCGITPVWASEIEPYPIAVTRSRFPFMQHLGNVTEINGGEIPPVDVVTFGSPCQDMSVAGKRAGIQHAEHGAEETTRSGLFYEAIRIIREMRVATNESHPTYAIWENVPGAFTSNGGEDFRCVLQALQEACGGRATIARPADGKWPDCGKVLGDGFSIAWRILDAQYWGVPQRRRRIYLVADFAGGRAGEILFERQSLCGDTTQGGEAGKGIAGDAQGGAGRGAGYGETGIGYWQRGIQCLRAEGENRPSRPSNVIVTPIAFHTQQDPISSESVTPCIGGQGQATVGCVYPTVCGSLCARADGSPCVDRGQPFVCIFMAGQGAKVRSTAYNDKLSPTLTGCPSGLNQAPSVVYTLDLLASNSMKSANPHSGFHEASIAKCVDTSDQNPSKNQGGMCVVTYDGRGIGNGATVSTIAGDHEAHPGDHANVLCYQIQAHGAYGDAATTAGTIKARDYKSATDLVLSNGKPPRRYIVRRLTPVECQRLQGFPDGWGTPDAKSDMADEETAFWEGVRRARAKALGKRYAPRGNRAALVKWYNKLHSDRAEYKMWGNGIALPCAVFVLEGIAQGARDAD